MLIQNIPRTKGNQLDFPLAAIYHGVMADQLQLISNRRNEIESLRAQHHSALKALADEDAELKIAERVITRLMGNHLFSEPPAAPTGNFDEPFSVPSFEPSPPVFTPSTTSPLMATGGKPEGTPTMPEMIIQILENRGDYGLPGATVKQIASDIGSKWWPAVTTTEINPIAWRMAKRGQIIKEGPLYKLPAPNADGVTVITPPPGDEPPEDEA